MSETLEEVKQRLIDAMALPKEEHADWLKHAEHKLYAHRATERPWERMYDVSTVGARIRTARTHLGMSQEQLAIRMRVHQGDVSGWERGVRNMPAELLVRFCAVCKIRKEWVLGLSEDGGPPLPEGQLRKKITRRWKERRDYQEQKAKAKAERARLNAAYQRRKEEG